MFLKQILAPVLTSVGGIAACHTAPEAARPARSSAVQQRSPSVRPYAVAKCVSSVTENGADRKTITLTATLVNNKLSALTGRFVQGSENESSEGGLEANIVKIAKGSSGEYLISLDEGLFSFADNSEGGEYTVRTQLIALDTAKSRLDTGSSLGSVGSCTFSNLGLLDRFVHKD